LHLSSSGATLLTIERTTAGNTNSNILFKNQVNSIYAGLFPTSGGFAVGTNQDLGTTPFFLISATGNVGIGTTTPARTRSLQGNQDISDGIFAANITATGTYTTANFNCATGTSTNFFTSALTAHAFAAGQTVPTTISSSGALNAPAHSFT